MPAELIEVLTWHIALRGSRHRLPDIRYEPPNQSHLSHRFFVRSKHGRIRTMCERQLFA